DLVYSLISFRALLVFPMLYIPTPTFSHLDFYLYFSSYHPFFYFSLPLFRRPRAFVCILFYILFLPFVLLLFPTLLHHFLLLHSSSYLHTRFLLFPPFSLFSSPYLPPSMLRL